MENLLYNRIRELAPENRPRERLAAHGVSTLSDLELLALMLGSGSGRRGVGKLARDLLLTIERGGDIPNVEELIRIDGIGQARASLVAASLEFARRRIRPAKKRIDRPEDVLPLVVHWADRPQEHFLVLSLNGAHEVIRIRVVSQGTLNRTIVHPRDVYIDPIQDHAATIICAHNHPSGNLDPSPEDAEVTLRLFEVGKLLGIPLLDHIVFSERGFYSFLEREGFE